MKLFSNKIDLSEEARDSSEAGYNIVIISPRTMVLEEINSILTMNNIDNNVDNIVESILDSESIAIMQHPDVIIADIADCVDVMQLKQTVDAVAPVNTRCILVGDNDSIMFSHEISKQGMHYLHLASQLAELPARIFEPTGNTFSRGSMIYSVLGCKGGSGASSFSYDLLQAVGAQCSIPLLMVQGAAGSLDLDLLLGKAIPRDGSILPLDKNISVRMETRENAWNFDDDEFNQFNIIFIDNPVYSCSQERLDYVLSRTHTFILVITHELSTLRVARELIENIRRRALAGNDAVYSRLFICLNEFPMASKNKLTPEDIEEYLGQKVDVIYTAQPTKKGMVDKQLSSFAARLLGKKTIAIAPKGAKVNGFASLLKKLKK
ncbi:tight adherence protein TadZ [Citrobacter rodentium]|uniref:Tight adherence protein TadZ n=2 Tax=Citrobacter rodentium TaxID=67825 RepID=D2TIS9_CITRI|nr:tight adherence protein TadZ [Citrobacter rodentium]KIQ50973.1 hypothetical protein TA05_12785 [Citrobacter rodentium]QBY30434.1 hypothetical protein E2R62_17445 [Citrobacter rodentium]UHO32196.1 hypothetical protein K7R23_05715 [Citrobacter rodentium NBRC 105723 = DSM 16636]CBG90839.1 putative tight adherence protein TadZ [Citrobacter rodentium ICC168]HAT8012628.1 hypothetical protein [Citrobacter rodentium NBRC 105723 = DSM 16636]